MESDGSFETILFAGLILSFAKCDEHETLDKAGAMGVDPPRIVHPCHTDPASVLYQIWPFAPLTMIATVVPSVVTATG